MSKMALRYMISDKCQANVAASVTTDRATLFSLCKPRGTNGIEVVSRRRRILPTPHYLDLGAAGELIR
jgi:hypothetical protein